jgi:hypothetical protein
MLPSPRTIKYFDALDREGDNFDFDAWLKRVRQEEAAESGKPSTMSPVDQVTDRQSNVARDGSRIGRVPRRILEPQKRNGKEFQRDPREKPKTLEANRSERSCLRFVTCGTKH